MPENIVTPTAAILPTLPLQAGDDPAPVGFVLHQFSRYAQIYAHS
jgi:hypothetical protein